MEAPLRLSHFLLPPLISLLAFIPQAQANEPHVSKVMERSCGAIETLDIQPGYDFRPLIECSAYVKAVADMLSLQGRACLPSYGLGADAAIVGFTVAGAPVSGTHMVDSVGELLRHLYPCP